MAVQEQRMGGWSEWHRPWPMPKDIQQISDKVRGDVAKSLGRDLKVYQVVEYRQQVVAGMNYEFKVMVTRLEIQAFRDLNGTVTLNAFKINPADPIEPQEQLAGGWSKMQKATPEVQKVAEQCRKEVQAGLKRQLPVYSAVSYQEQVVAGANFRIMMMLGQCREEVYADLKQNVSLTEFSVLE